MIRKWKIGAPVISAVDASRSEVVLVNVPHGDYVYCVITKTRPTPAGFKK
jgi:hypothetical protein